MRSVAPHRVLAAADAASDRDAFRLNLDSAGNPADPSLLIAWTAGLDNREIELLAGKMQASQRVVVLVVDEVQPPSTIMASADVILASSDTRLAGAVESDDPRTAARGLASQMAGSARASIALAWLLRESGPLAVPAAITAESGVYSTLLAGPDFRRWLADRGAPRPSDPGGSRPDRRLRLVRHDNELRITLSQAGAPQRGRCRNA